MEDNYELLNRFEDLDDMFDFIVENFQKNIRDWIVFSKLGIGPLEKEVSGEVLKHLVETEFQDQYPRTHAIIEKREHGNIIVGIYRRTENDRRRPR